VIRHEDAGQAHGSHRKREGDEGNRVLFVFADERCGEWEERNESQVEQVLRHEPPIDSLQFGDEPVVVEPVLADHQERDCKAHDLGDPVIERVEHHARAVRVDG
jgi:hypothetical protein